MTNHLRQNGAVIELHSPSGNFICRVHPQFGGRIGSVSIDGNELLITENESPDPLLWGCYPMVPYAGRVRNAQFTWSGKNHRLRINAEPHAIHGTVFDRSWTLLEQAPGALSMNCELGDDWPYRATVRHDITITDDELRMALTVTAAETMPVQIGWHPWFAKPVSSTLNFGAMLLRDEVGIATTQQLPHPAHHVDECFVHPEGNLTITIGRHTVVLDSDCTHWVIYDLPAHATCIEPQSGAPNALNDAPELLRADHSFRRYFSWRVQKTT